VRISSPARTEARPPQRQGDAAAVRAARLRFLTVFGLVSLTFIGLYHFPYPDGSFPLQLIGANLRAYARAAGALLSAFDPAISVDGTLISGRFPLRIVKSCDAGEAMALIVAAVVAFPASRSERLAGAAFSLAVIYLMNVLRIGSLYLVGVRRPDLFDLIHVDVWPAVIIGVAALLFLAWVAWVRRVDRTPAPDAA
jgi:exosortase family protein XrtM